MKTPSFITVLETDQYIVIRDVGPWDIYPTITNGAEIVVRIIALTMTESQRLFYYDSEGELGELEIKDGQFDDYGNEIPEDLVELLTALNRT
jgi:hypothetical protein